MHTQVQLHISVDHVLPKRNISRNYVQKCSEISLRRDLGSTLDHQIWPKVVRNRPLGVPEDHLGPPNLIQSGQKCSLWGVLGITWDPSSCQGGPKASTLAFVGRTLWFKPHKYDQKMRVPSHAGHTTNFPKSTGNPPVVPLKNIPEWQTLNGRMADPEWQNGRTADPNGLRKTP